MPAKVEETCKGQVKNEIKNIYDAYHPEHKGPRVLVTYDSNGQYKAATSLRVCARRPHIMWRIFKTLGQSEHCVDKALICVLISRT